MKIAGLQKTSLIDYPEHIVSIVFTQGCNFKCPYCHNPSLIPLENKDRSYLSVDKLSIFLQKRRNLIDGVSITGGEPTLHPDLTGLIKTIKSMDLKVKLDTNGTNPGLIKELIEDRLLDYIAMDVKGPLEKYSIITGSENFSRNIVESIELIRRSNIDYEFRTTLVPGLIEVADMTKIGKLIKGAKLYFIQNFRSTNTYDPDFMKLNRFPPSLLDKFKEVIIPHVKKVKIRE